MIPYDKLNERRLLNCHLTAPATLFVPNNWFWSELRSLLHSTCELAWQQKLFRHPRPRRSSRLQILESWRAADWNAGMLYRTWPNQRLKRELEAIRESNGVPELFDYYADCLREAAEARDEIERLERRLKELCEPTHGRN